MRSFLILILATGIFCFSFQKALAQGKNPENTIFIFDASGSMNGKIDRSTKIQVAKETMEKLADKIKPGSKVGLIAYGHKSATSCNDIETLLPVAAFDKTSFINTIKSINPKGKTPIALSINHALALIRSLDGPATVILVSDGLETCEGNACETVRNAKAAGVKLTMHVVGFGISEKNLSPLECIAQAGGGQYFPADNANDLAEALEKTVEEQPAGNAFLSVRTSLEGKLKDATVRVYKKGERKEIAFGRTYESKETNPRVLKLQAGTYDIEVKPITIEGYQPVKLQDVVIHENETVLKEVVFEQGVIEVSVTRNEALSDATIQIFETGTTKTVASTRSYTNSKTNPARLKVPPGLYDIVIVSVEIKGKAEKKIFKTNLTPGTSLSFSHNFESGELNIGAKRGLELIDATVNIYSTKTNLNVAAGRTYQASSSNPKNFILEPGKYLVELKPVKPAGLEKKSVTVEITAKGILEKTIEW